MTILIIALLHGLPVYLVGIWKQSKWWMSFALLLSITIGILVGNPKYVGVDIVASIIGYFIGWIELSRYPYNKTSSSTSPQLGSIFTKFVSVIGKLVVIVIIMAVLYMYAFYKNSELEDASTAVATGHTPVNNVPVAIKPANRAPLKSKTPKATNKEKTVSTTERDNEKAIKEAYCLSLKTDAEKIECLDSY